MLYLNVLGTFFHVINNVLGAEGGNDYELPHCGTQRAQKHEELEWEVTVNPLTLEKTKQMQRDALTNEGMAFMMN